MDNDRPTPLEADEIRQDVIVGVPIFGRDETRISTIDHLHGEGEKTQVAFDVGGFLGIGSRRVALLASQLDFMRDAAGDVYAVTQMTEDQLEALPEHEDDKPALS
ncbi:PRC-barrel domain containing protein [Salmonella enterica subsp. enterica]|nr:PRC-barrel domain containing protein [Escherichia coli]MIL09814.1 PRC-barrel domain containing protein [Salmonella enterica subsp. enterica serovar Enteritidis]